MSEPIRLTTPLTQDKVRSLHIGDRVLISGTIYAARDAAHKRMVETLDRGEPLPVDLRDQIVYYVGPSPAKPGQAIGSAGPTTSGRMDAYAPRLMEKGLSGMIGKGNRSQAVKDAMQRYGTVYFAATGGEWDDREYYASNYFDQLYAFAEQLIRDGKAYVDSQSAEEIRASRGTLTQPGTESPYRNRSIEENLDLFHRMRGGEFADGEHVLRAKIDMASPNVVMRDPTLYRIRHAEHHRTGDKWCVYPMYDFTHCLSDSLEGITHSICTLEFVNNRELYDWVLDALNVYHPQQIEFARLGLTYTVLSKRKLIQLVKGEFVRGWDDPRMPTICGMRRRGYTPEAIRDFCSRIGVARAENLVEYSLLEFCVREHLNAIAPRTMAVLDPIKVVIENYPEGQVEWFDMPFSQDGSVEGSRKVPFSRELYIERDDFREDPPKKFHRLFPGSEVRLRYAYYVTCKDVIKDTDGNIVELRCTYDPESKGGATPDGRKIKGTIHWVSVPHAVSAEVRLYEHLFTSPTPGNTPEGVEFTDLLNPDSMRVVTAQVEPALAEFPAGSRVQFERLGYFCVDPDSKPGAPVFNRTVTLKDSWAKIEGKQ